MKKTVLTFGLIAGVILSAMMVVAILFKDAIGFDSGEIVGYTSMVLAFLLIFFGVRSYRDNVAGGTVRFGRAFAVGASIAAIASICYVVTWQVMYFNFFPNYAAEYQAHVLEKARADGLSEEALAKKKADWERYAELYQNPAINAAVTFLEPLPVALIVALVSAGVLSRQKKSGVGETADGRASTVNVS